MSTAATAPDALAPVRSFLLARARADAERIRAEAAADADGVLAQARQQAEAVLAEAAQRGAAEGAEAAAATRARARRRVRGLQLAAQRQAYEALRQRSRAAAQALREDPCYPRLRRRLAVLARERVGADAVTSDAPGGGVIAVAPGRRADYSLGALAERAVEELGAEVEGLWAP
jgi:vacuolar-type H+-ATPase subunit E/Vma4